MARTVTGDVEVGGCPLRAGDRMLIPWVAANHDPAVFPEPEEIRLDRDAEAGTSASGSARTGAPERTSRGPCSAR